MEPVPMEVDNYPKHDIPDINGPLSKEECRRDTIIENRQMQRVGIQAHRMDDLL